MPADLQFSAVAHYLCDPTQTPNSRSRVAALCHLYNLSTVALSVKVEELQHLVEKILGKKIENDPEIFNSYHYIQYVCG
jgi:hypothetical protein